MAGSLRWFRYLSDNLEAFAIFADESNTELINQVIDSQASVAGLKPLPKSVKPRYVTLANSSNTISRKCYVLNPVEYQGIDNATTRTLTPANFSGVSESTPVVVILKQPEISRRLPKDADTGLNDGDNP